MAAISETSPVLVDYVDDWGEVEWGRLRDEKGAEAWRFFMPIGLDIDAAQVPDPVPAAFAECCDVLAATMGLLSLTADGQQLWAITMGDENDAESDIEDVEEAESDEEAYEDEDA